jgi:hypothetical protein
VDAETGLTQSIRLGVPDDIAKGIVSLNLRRRRLHDRRRPCNRRRLDGTLAKRDGELGSLLFGKKLGERRFLRL